MDNTSLASTHGFKKVQDCSGSIELIIEITIISQEKKKKKREDVAINPFCSLLLAKISLSIAHTRIFSWKHFTLHGFIGSSSILIAGLLNKAHGTEFLPFAEF